MTRKKIDLALATEDWMKSKFTRPDGLWSYDSHVANLVGGNMNHAELEERKQRARWARMLDDALDLPSSIDRLWVEPRHGKITMCFNCTFDAKGLNRVMNSEIHYEGLVFTFDSLGLEVEMEGDYYWGEYTERPRAAFALTYRSRNA